MSLALVLEGGGITGAAWEAGILKGLRDAGIDLTVADRIIGTSAGAVVGAAITTGGLDAFWERQIGPVDTAIERTAAVDRVKFANALREAGLPNEVTQSALARLGRAAIAAEVDFTHEERLRTMASRLGGAQEWPNRQLMITAIDCDDGSLAVWTRDSGVPLIAAVASSCAAPFIYPVATINGRRYMDGGVRNGSNADLARGSDRVVVIAPVARSPLFGGTVLANVEALRAQGARALLIEPDVAASEVMAAGSATDPARRRPAAEAGLAQAPAVVTGLPDWLAGPQEHA